MSKSINTMLHNKMMPQELISSIFNYGNELLGVKKNASVLVKQV